ncbi:bZIP transcription factor 18-like [Larimichthys crocea]|uniref:bZIP transcription factor 18-like n=1 Tax=Larimichthys crocea TaxID=215358 RepID=UPI000F5F8C10|nr:bZIP transcription factor 18-like [Larimichthys crocea]XP_027128570.1 bZIP transcription factor 18-like [Larimichthys crocea]
MNTENQNAEDQNTDGPGQTTSKSGPVFLGLSRCDNCYKHKAISWKGVDGESSSSEGSGAEVESEEEESSSSSSCSEKDSSEILEESETEKPSLESGDSEETSEVQEDKSSTKAATQRAPLVKSFSLPASFTPRLTPLSLLPRPQTIVSTLNLQVEKHDLDAFHIVKQQLTEEEERTEGGRGGINNQRSKPTLQERQLSYQYQQQPHQHFYQHQQQQQPQHFSPLSAQGQMLPPPLHTLPVLHHPTLNAAQRYPHPQPCMYCSSMQLPHSPHCSNGQLHR